MQVGYAITKMPEGFHLHKGVKRVYDQRRQMIETGEGIDWGMAEALAFGTLLSEGKPLPHRQCCVPTTSAGTTEGFRCRSSCGDGRHAVDQCHHLRAFWSPDVTHAVSNITDILTSPWPLMCLWLSICASTQYYCMAP